MNEIYRERQEASAHITKNHTVQENRENLENAFAIITHYHWILQTSLTYIDIISIINFP